MKFKNTKKPATKTPSPKVLKTTLKKEEIKEIIEETVEEVLKEQSSDNKPQVESIITPNVETDLTNVEDEKAEIVEAVAPVTVSLEQEQADSAEQNTVKQDSESSSPTPVAVGDNKEGESAGPEITLSSSPFGDNAATTPVMPEQQSGFINEPEEPSKKSPFLGIFIALFAFGIVVGGGFWYLSSHNMLSTTKLQGLLPLAKPTPTNAPLPTAAPTAKQVDVSMYTVAVLNGSGVAGEASKVRTLLTSDGFTVSNTGNATSSDYVQTVISAKASVSQDALDKLMNTLSKQYTVSQHSVTLSTSESTDIVVTVGTPK